MANQGSIGKSGLDVWATYPYPNHYPCSRQVDVIYSGALSFFTDVAGNARDTNLPAHFYDFPDCAGGLVIDEEPCLADPVVRGSIGMFSPISFLTVLPVWAYNVVAQPLAGAPDNTGRIRGRVEVEGVLQSNVPVHLFYNINGIKINTAFTEEDGSYQFIGLEVGNPYYTVEGHVPGYNNVVVDGVAAKPIT